MPGLNGQGPMNQGSMTGRGLGRCAAPGASEDYLDTAGRGFVRGRGGQRRCRFFQTARFEGPQMADNRPSLLETLLDKTARLEEELAALRRSLSDKA